MGVAEVIEMDCSINDAAFADAMADKLHAQVLSVNYPDITDALITRVESARSFRTSCLARCCCALWRKKISTGWSTSAATS